MRAFRSLSPVLLLGIALACQPIRSQPANDPDASGEGDEGPAEVSSPLLVSEPLVFPPAPDARRARVALPESFAVQKTDGAPEVAYPRLDTGTRSFSFSGQTLRIVFDRPMKGPGEEGKSAKRVPEGSLVISPAVAGKTAWAGDRYLEFTADEPFDPDQTYQVVLGGLEDADGTALEAWSARFTADPEIHIAGKIISYLPEPGKHRVVATSPLGGDTVGVRHELAVLYDQPIELDRAEDMIQLRDSSNRLVPVKLRHPKKKTFRGLKVDPKFAVEIVPQRRLKAGESYEISARDHDDSPTESEFTFADRLAFASVDCGYGYDDNACEWGDGVLHTDGSEVTLVFNNPIGMDPEQITKAIEVSPRVPNLSVWSSYYEGRVFLYGGFEPSKRYRVTVKGVKDVYGNRLSKPAKFEVVTAPLAASVSMPEGMLVLDEHTTRNFGVTSRNVAAAQLQLWPVEAGAQAWQTARSKVDSGQLPDGVAPIQIRVTPQGKRDQHAVTKVDLSKYVHAGQDYLATIKLERPAHGARPMEFPEWSDAGRPPVALLTPGYGDALAIHARASTAGTIVHVAKLDDGTPISGAKLFLGDDALDVKTDKLGFALLDLGRADLAGAVVRAEAGKATGRLEMSGGAVDERRIAPELASGTEPTAEGLVGMVITDRGIYRPGARVFIKGTVRRRSHDALAPVRFLPLTVRVLGPGGEEVFRQKAFADDMGSVAVHFDVPSSQSLGRHRILVEPTLRPEVTLAEDIIQVAEFEPPRFTVDVSAEQTGKRQLQATVEGRYLFGAAMDAAMTDWTLRRSEAAFPSGPLTDGGFDFRRQRSWWDEEEEAAWMRVGSGTLDADGKLVLEQALEIDADAGPQRFTLEAQVSDASYRTIAGRGSVVLHPADRYAGLRVQTPWADVGQAIPVELGVVDTEGHAVTGAKAEAKLELIDWRYTRKRGPGGSVRYEWHKTRKLIQRCQVETAADARSCDLTPPTSGDYEITALVDGRAGGVRSLWAWDDEGDEPVRRPEKGNRLELVTDKRKYEVGDTAKILVTNPFPAATAILTVEQDGILSHQRRRIDGSASLFEVPIEAAHAPHVHATVTLLPIGAKGDQVAQWKFGATRLAVVDEGARLAVDVDSDAQAYEPGQSGKVKIRVMQGKKPAAHAEVALAVVDEGILRLTNFHAADPVAAMRSGRALRLLAADTRDQLAAARERSHVAGDGGGEGSQSVTQARRDFVETMLWEPNLRTDAEGFVEVDMKMPDNLSTFRMMAVALDHDGRGGFAESKFLVRKPIMLVPVVPRFASVGDRFEVAGMVHNNTDEAFSGVVKVLDEEKPITLQARGSQRVSFDLVTRDPGNVVLDFRIEEPGGKVRDRVESVVPVQAPGIDARPRISAAFLGDQEVMLDVPRSIEADRSGEDWITVTVGQHLAPDLGTRLEYLVDYPHGCVEQTTSSTLPLIAAREILPRIGMTRFGKDQIDDMIRAGLKRLDTMKTSSGGLAYWPGGWQPNVYGTAYAMRAVVRAELAGIEVPPGLLAGMRGYLENNLMSGGVPPEVRAAIAQSLGELGELPSSAADSLWDTREEQGVFGHASLAIALSSLDGQEDRVKQLIDDVEEGFSADGELQKPPGSDDFYYYGSSQRTRAQAAIALARLRPRSPLFALLTAQMGRELPSYTTQGTAYELLALAERMQTVEDDGAAFELMLDGEPLEPVETLEHGIAQYRISLDEVKGKRKLLRLQSESDQAIAFMISARWRRGLDDARGLVATSGASAPDVHRLYTDTKGRPVSLEAIDPGTVLRVALLVRMPTDRVAYERLGYLAITDRLPAGFEAVQTDLWTVAKAPDLDESHPFYDVLRWSENDATHVEMHDDRVDLYFDRTWGTYVGATYLVRATTPGSFLAPPPAAELMYEADGTGYGEPTRVVVR